MAFPPASLMPLHATRALSNRVLRFSVSSELLSSRDPKTNPQPASPISQNPSHVIILIPENTHSQIGDRPILCKQLCDPLRAFNSDFAVRYYVLFSADTDAQLGEGPVAEKRPSDLPLCANRALFYGAGVVNRERTKSEGTQGHVARNRLVQSGELLGLEFAVAYRSMLPPAGYTCGSSQVRWRCTERWVWRRLHSP